MKKPSPASTSNNVPSRSAWVKGPPQKSSVPNNTTSQTSTVHSRRPANPVQSVNIQEGVSVPRSYVESLRQGSAVTFGSIDDASAPVWSSPGAAPTINAESVKSFGSMPISSIPSTTAAPSASNPAAVKIDLKKLFQSARSSQASLQSNFGSLPSSAQFFNASPPFQQHPLYAYLGPHARPGSGVRPQHNEVGLNNAPLPAYPAVQGRGLTGAPPAVTAPPERKLASSARAFVPRPHPKITIRDLNGVEVSLDDLKKRGTASSGSPGGVEGETKKKRLKEKRRLKKEAEELQRIVETLRVETEEAKARRMQESKQGDVRISTPPVYGNDDTGIDPLGMDVSTTSPLSGDRPKPDPANLGSPEDDILGPLPSVYANARFIEDISQIKYPDGIKTPKVELNINAKDGKYRYDRDFLLQFQSLCREKPHTIPLEPLGLVLVRQSPLVTILEDSGRHHQASSTQSKQSEEGSGADRVVKNRVRAKRGQKKAGVHQTGAAQDSASPISDSPARGDIMLFDPAAPLDWNYNPEGVDKSCLGWP